MSEWGEVRRCLVGIYLLGYQRTILISPPARQPFIHSKGPLGSGSSGIGLIFAAVLLVPRIIWIPKNQWECIILPTKLVQPFRIQPVDIKPRIIPIEQPIVTKERQDKGALLKLPELEPNTQSCRGLLSALALIKQTSLPNHPCGFCHGNGDADAASVVALEIEVAGVAIVAGKVVVGGAASGYECLGGKRCRSWMWRMFSADVIQSMARRYFW